MINKSNTWGKFGAQICIGLLSTDSSGIVTCFDMSVTQENTCWFSYYSANNEQCFQAQG